MTCACASVCVERYYISRGEGGREGGSIKVSVAQIDPISYYDFMSLQHGWFISPYINQQTEQKNITFPLFIYLHLRSFKICKWDASPFTSDGPVLNHCALPPRRNSWESRVAPVLYDTDLCLVMNHHLLHTAVHFNQLNSSLVKSLQSF